MILPLTLYARLRGSVAVLPTAQGQFAVGSHTQISIRANDIALSRRYVHGISIQNQIKGRICALIPCAASLIVQIDFGGTLLAEITPGACRELTLQEGDTVYCLIKTHAIVFLADLDHLPYQRVIRHGDGYYYLESPSLAGDVAVRERVTSALQA